ncbi:MAG: sigma-70 family RNA polymerase sigma factor [Planctomycetota bacterium]|nr:MAG: sigma-70 family RNA polymerase sigma factor [Planctomycetota bacterium]
MATPARKPAIAEPNPTSRLRLVDDRTDEELLVLHREGDPTAFRVLMGRHRADLMRFLTRFMGSRQAAEDVFQETFFQVHLSAATFDESRRFKPWLYTIAANKGRDLHRRNARKPTVGLSAPLDADSGRTYVDLMELDAPAPGDSIEAAEQDRLVQRAVDALPERQREILLLAYFQKMTYVQIAEVLQIPIGTVKSRLHAAVAMFARHWKAVLEARGEAAPDD